MCKLNPVTVSDSTRKPEIRIINDLKLPTKYPTNQPTTKGVFVQRMFMQIIFEFLQFVAQHFISIVIIMRSQRIERDGNLDIVDIIVGLAGIKMTKSAVSNLCVMINNWKFFEFDFTFWKDPGCTAILFRHKNYNKNNNLHEWHKLTSSTDCLAALDINTVRKWNDEVSSWKMYKNADLPIEYHYTFNDLTSTKPTGVFGLWNNWYASFQHSGTIFCIFAIHRIEIYDNDNLWKKNPWQKHV